MRCLRNAHGRGVRVPLLALVLACASVTASATEADRSASASPFGAGAHRTPASRLAEARGGYQPAGGLQVSFSIARNVLVDGTTVASATLVGPGLADGGGALSLQPGSGSGALAGAGPTTLLQNALDGRQFRLATLIEANVNSLALARQGAWQMSLRDALIGTLRR